jgi:hypothetical protein
MSAAGEDYYPKHVGIENVVLLSVLSIPIFGRMSLRSLSLELLWQGCGRLLATLLLGDERP